MNEITIVVTTSDGYTSLIDGFIFFYNKFNPDNNFNLFFALESVELNSYSNFNFITTYKKNWSERLHFVLESIESEFVFIIPEDFYLAHKVDLLRVQDLLSFSINHKIDHLGGFSNQDNTTLELFSNGMEYFSVDKTWFKPYIHLFSGSGIYRRTFLMKILRKNENIWEFETNAGYRVNQFTVNNYRYKTNSEPFAVYPPGIISRGELTNDGSDFLKIHNYELEWVSQKRKVTTFEDSRAIRLARIPFRLLKRIANILFNKF